MNTSTCFRINGPNVIHEIIDGEAVLVNLNNGSYYSVDQVGADIWRHIEQGAPVGQIIDAIAHQYVGDREDVKNGVNQLVGQLQQESLIVPVEAGQSDANASPHATASTDHKDRPRFEEPTLHKYTDMEDLLLLDPIHDVDETGWPHEKPENT